MHEQEVIEVVEQRYILSCAYKWLGEKAVHCVAIPDFETKDDLELCQFIWSLLDEAEIVIAQNGDAFDIKRLNARFIIHKLPPPSPYRTIDTLKVAQSTFGFNSNRLNAIGKDLSEGEKLKHRGFDMWVGCMKGRKQDFEDMKRYNKQDVLLLERIYLRLRPWIKNHPNLSAYNNGSCPKCGSFGLQSRGYTITQMTRFQRFQCQGCGGWSRNRVAKEAHPRSSHIGL